VLTYIVKGVAIELGTGVYMRAIYTGAGRLYASVIILTITILVGSIAAIWITSMISTSIYYHESLFIYPNATITRRDSSWELSMSIENRGGSPAIITEIRVSEYRCYSEEIKIDPGRSQAIKCSLGMELTPWAYYDVRIITKAGNIFMTRVRAD
jgi:hypothetical protein